MEAARALVDGVQGEHTYGVNTGFGRFVSRQIPEELAEELQLRLLRSHACGVGEPYADDVVRAAMLLRANTLAKGSRARESPPSSCCSSA
jgi:histidine ammonia-lyase